MIGGDIWCDRVLTEAEVRRALSGAFRVEPRRIWLIYGMTLGDYLDLHDDTPPRESFDLFCVATVDAPEGFLFHLDIGVDGETTEHFPYLDRNDIATFCRLARCNGMTAGGSGHVYIWALADKQGKLWRIAVKAEPFDREPSIFQIDHNAYLFQGCLPIPDDVRDDIIVAVLADVMDRPQTAILVEPRGHSRGPWRNLAPDVEIVVRWEDVGSAVCVCDRSRLPWYPKAVMARRWETLTKDFARVLERRLRHG